MRHNIWCMMCNKYHWFLCGLDLVGNEGMYHIKLCLDCYDDYKAQLKVDSKKIPLSVMGQV